MKGKTAESKAAEDANEYRELLNQVKIATRVLNHQSVRVGSRAVAQNLLRKDE